MDEKPTGTVTFMFTDVVQSSQLWDGHHDAMQTAMAEHDELMRSSVAAHRGVVVKQTGDGIFAVFASAFDSVEAGVDVQASIAERSWPGLPEGIEVRIGIHTGEAELRDGDYFGASVTRAARVMGLAGGGEVLVSASTYQVVVDRLAGGLALHDVGQRDLRGLSRPERVFSLSAGDAHQLSSSPSSSTSTHTPAPRAVWIAVLPFENIGDDPDREYFAGGITEDIMTGLAACRSLRVVARSSSFQFKGSGKTSREVARELGARFVLEGSVRCAGGRIRVTTRLIDASDGHQLWADRSDGDMADIFDLQDEITRNVVGAIDPAIRLAEAERVTRTRPDSLDAWDHVQQGWSALWKYKRASTAEAIGHFRTAVSNAPDYAEAHAGLALAEALNAWLWFSPDPRVSLETALEMAKRAVELDDRDAMSHSAFAWVSYALGRLRTAAGAAERAIALNPSLADAYIVGGVAIAHGGDPASGIELIVRGMELSPMHPMSNWFFGGKAIAHFLLHENDAAIADARTALQIRHGYLFARVVLVASLVEVEQIDEARRELSVILSLEPEFSAARLDLYTFSDPTALPRLLSGLRSAGLGD